MVRYNENVQKFNLDFAEKCSVEVEAIKDRMSNKFEEEKKQLEATFVQSNKLRKENDLPKSKVEVLDYMVLE